MRRVLVTGGAGFIGRHLVDHLLAAGDVEVIVIDNESLGDRAELDESHVEFVAGDIRDREQLGGALHGVDAVVHLAADTRVVESIENPVNNFDNNVVGTFNLLELCRERGIRRVVAASTGGAIVGDVPPPVHEEMAAQPTAPYGASKLMMEGYLSAYSAAYGLQGCALRFSNIYGPRSFHKGSVVAHFAKRILAGEPLVVYGDGSQARDFLYVSDLVAGIRTALDSDAVGTFQLGSGAPTTVDELLDLMREVTGRELDVQYEPFRPGEVVRTWCQIDKARAELGFEPVTPLADGLRQTWEWFQAQQSG